MTEPEAASAEKEDAFDTEGQPSSSAAAGRATEEKGEAELSAVSKQYDLGNKGYLDDTEKKMRAYDRNNDGTLDIAEIYKIVQDVQRQQRELQDERKKILNMKKVIVGLVIFTVVLALAMLGVSFAAATLAKDTSVDPASNSLSSKATRASLSTVGSTRDSRIGLVAEDDARYDEEEGAGGGGAGDGGGGNRSRRVLHGSMATMTRVQGQRETMPCYRPPTCYDYDDDPSPSPGPGPNRPYRPYPYNDRDQLEDCRSFEGVIPWREYDNIVRSIESQETSFMMSYYPRGSSSERYWVRVDNHGGYYDEWDGYLAVDGGAVLDCNQPRAGDCAMIKPVYIFENCVRGDECEVYTCALPLNTN